jgi:beta-lactamase class A
MRTQQTRSTTKPVAIIALLLVVATIGYYKFRAAEAGQSASHIDTGLQQIVNNWGAQQPFGTSVVIRELDGSLRTADRNPNVAMTTASTYKIYVAYATLHEVEQGKYTMLTRTRTGQTVSGALNKMIVQSDNTSAEALGFLVGWNTVDSLAAQQGATNTYINNYDSTGHATIGEKHSTTADLTLMITKLQQDTLLNATDTKLLLELMKTQVWRERVPAGVPANIAVADKPGWLTNVQNDAAVVYGPKSTYTIVIMTTGNATKPLANLSAQVYDYLEK